MLLPSAGDAYGCSGSDVGGEQAPCLDGTEGIRRRASCCCGLGDGLDDHRLGRTVEPDLVGQVGRAELGLPLPSGRGRPRSWPRSFALAELRRREAVGRAPDIERTYWRHCDDTVGAQRRGPNGGITPLRPFVMVSLMSPARRRASPCRSGWGKPLLPAAAAPWHCCAVGEGTGACPWLGFGIGATARSIVQRTCRSGRRRHGVRAALFLGGAGSDASQRALVAAPGPDTARGTPRRRW